MRINTFVLMAAFLVSFTVIFWFVSPPEVKDKIKGVFDSSSNERLCFDIHKRTFNDPDSAYVVDSYLTHRKGADSIEEPDYAPATPLRLNDKGEVEVDYELKEKSDLLIAEIEAKRKEVLDVLVVNVAAKNMMGAYVKTYIECPLSDGKVSELTVLTDMVNKDSRH